MAGNADVVLSREIAKYYDDPLGYVMFMFPWRTDPSIQMVKLQEPYRSRYNCEYGPDKWCCEFLDDLGAEIKKRKFNGRDPVAPIRFSTASGHGIGKSTLVAWLIMFILDTRPYSMGMVTATTADQLRTKTWAELAKWHHLSLSSHLWEYSNSQGHMSISRRGEKAVKAKWRCDGLTAKPENAEAFQGLHAANSTPFYIFDEASGVENPIWEARLGGATDGEPMSFDFGNPTRKSGYFYENCVGQYKDQFIVRQIDSRNVAITNKQYLNELKDMFGESSDLFGVKVKGQFPNAGSVQFIPSDLVDDAMHRSLIPDKNDPIIIGVDVARFGANDTVIFTRIGMDGKSIPFKRFNGLDTTQVVDKVIEAVNSIRLMGKNVSGLFVDGGGLGAGPVDMLRRLGYNPIDVNFGKSASDPRYRRWGDQMWGNLKDALPRMALPNNIDLKTQLTQREYDIPQGKITLESKKDMSERLGGKSPDIADALVLTFAQEVAYGHNHLFGSHLPLVAKSDYDPMAIDW
jgi:hypothetical protein